MQLNRVQFSDQDGSNIYTVPINPVAATLIDSSDVVVTRTLDGAPIAQYSTFDGRIRTLTWANFSDSNTNFASLEAELKSYKGQLKRINLRSIDTPSFGWKNIIITNVSTKILDNSGRLRHNIVLEFIFTEQI